MKLWILETIASAFAVALQVVVDCLSNESPHLGRQVGCSIIPRKRKSVELIWSDMGTFSGRRAYQMHEQSFWKLHQILEQDLRGSKKRYLPSSPSKFLLGRPLSNLSLKFDYADFDDKCECATAYTVFLYQEADYLSF